MLLIWNKFHFNVKFELKIIEKHTFDHLFSLYVAVSLLYGNYMLHTTDWRPLDFPSFRLFRASQCLPSVRSDRIHI